MVKFWRPRDKHGCFSNFSGHPILVDGKIYKTTEHYYQSKKFYEEDAQEAVRKAKTPMQSKDMANGEIPMIVKKVQLHPKLRPDWEEVKFGIMKDALRYKVQQHEDVKQELLSTGDETLVEDSPYDYVWGVGKDGTGTNLLGKAWMEIRSELRSGVIA